MFIFVTLKPYLMWNEYLYQRYFVFRNSIDSKI